MQDKSDAQLLREYAAEKSEAAFGEVVRRHADMVYSAALRQVQSADGAKEIAQRVFIDLARRARSLAARMRADDSAAAWLYRAARYAALNLLREERRRHSREIQIMQDTQPSFESTPDWNSMAPLLDEAMASLNEQERAALLLRFFKNLDFRAVGAALGISDDTAQKRVARGLEKLRGILARRGVTTTSAALSSALAANAVQAAPAGMAAAWAGASLAGAKFGGSLTMATIMSMTKFQMGLSAIVAGGLAVTVAMQQQSGRKAREENQALRQQIAGFAAANQAPSNRVQQTAPHPSLPEDQFRELLRLRGEVGMLRQQTNAVPKLQEENRALQAEAKTAEARAATADAWYQAVSARTVNAAKLIGVAARVYANDNNGVYPTNFAEMSNELANFPTNIPLETFEMVNMGKASQEWPQAVFARERTPRPDLSGRWHKIYLFCDGSAQIGNSDDGNFDNWEQSNTFQIPPAGTAAAGNP
ncbi:MAG TPA: sigma-70 family RNA polymerase sigma factor [Verrucomicrobiae bacterium]|jgi:RNA polymerase sigma factor (sigma-70 family)